MPNIKEGLPEPPHHMKYLKHSIFCFMSWFWNRFGAQSSLAEPVEEFIFDVSAIVHVDHLQCRSH